METRTLGTPASQTDDNSSRDLRVMRIAFVNVYMIGTPENWILVDTGLPFSEVKIRRAAAELYGPDSSPYAILLTHGHFDHAGSALELAGYWNVPIYAHPLELPYLTGLSDYPPQDPTVGGALAFLSRFFPHHGYDFVGRIRGLPHDGSVPGLHGWRWIHTPGHTPGHVSLFRDADQVLIAGDALATMNLDSPFRLISRTQELRRPPAPFTTDWIAARQSVERLADLWPSVIAAGHGQPMEGQQVAGELRSFAAAFEPPRKGRYVPRPAITDEQGVVELPPRPSDPLPNLIASAAIAATGVAIYKRWRGHQSSAARRQ